MTVMLKGGLAPLAPTKWTQWQ